MSVKLKMDFNNILEDAKYSVLIGFLIVLGILLYSKLGLDYSWYKALGLSIPIGIFAFIIIVLIKSSNPSRD